jgi:glycosyltransferase involved in cell wall biosynthesis
MMRIAVVCRQSHNRVDGVRDHAVLLADALRARGAEVDLHLRTAEGGWIVEPGDGARPKLVAGLGRYDAVLVQYNPFMWGRWGFAPWLPAALLRLRRGRQRARIAVILHEPFVPMTGWRWTLMGLWQRAQLAAVRAAADSIFVSIEAWTQRLERWRPRRPTFHLPVGSNFPDRSDARNDERHRLGVEPEDLVVAIIDTGGAARSPRLVTGALERLAEADRRIVLLVLGAGGSLPPDLPPAVEAHLAGRLDPSTFAARLSAADLFLAPYVDGASTRRGSMMAALQHGVAVVGTNGFLTDAVLRNATSALRLAPVDRPELFAAAAYDLAANARERADVGRAGRALYAERFEWDVIAAQLLREL